MHQHTQRAQTDWLQQIADESKSWLNTMATKG